MNRYVPQSVMTPEGEILDIHIVLNEMFKSGDKLFVEYSDGPIAYKARSVLRCVACKHVSQTHIAQVLHPLH